MADEFKTVLRIEGDASGAIESIRRAKSEHGKLAEQVAADNAAMSAAASNAQATSQTAWKAEPAAQVDVYGGSKTPADSARQTQEAGKAIKDTADRAEQARPKLAALARAASMLSPEFGSAIASASLLKKALGELLTLPGAMFTAVGVAVGILVSAIKESEEKLRKVYEESEKIRKEAEERRRGTRQTAAGMGISPEAARRGAARAAVLEQRGFSKETAARAGALAADQGLSDEQAMQLAAGMELGQVTDVGHTERSRRRAIERFFGRTLARPEEAQANAAAILNASAQRRDEAEEQIRQEQRRLAQPELSVWEVLFPAAKKGPLRYVGFRHTEAPSQEPQLQAQIRSNERAATSATTIINHGTINMSRPGLDNRIPRAPAA